WKGAWEGVQEAGLSTWSRIKDNAMLAVNDISTSIKSMGDVWNASLPTVKAPKGIKPEAPLHENLDWLTKIVADGKTATDSSLKLAGATELVGAAQIEAKAQVEAATQIQKLNNEEMSKGFGLTKAYKEKLSQLTPEIKANAIWSEIAKSVKTASTEYKDLDKELDKQLASYRAAASALDPYQKEIGELNAKLDPLKKHLAAVTEEYNRQLAKLGPGNARVKELKGEIDN